MAFTLFLEKDYGKSVILLISSVLLIVKYILEAKLKSTFLRHKFCFRRGRVLSFRVANGEGLIFRYAAVDIATNMFGWS